MGGYGLGLSALPGYSTVETRDTYIAGHQTRSADFARVITVSDVLEAMASHRPYRLGLGIDAALEEIEKGRGIHYDTKVVDTCLRLFREKGYRFAEG